MFALPECSAAHPAGNPHSHQQGPQLGAQGVQHSQQGWESGDVPPGHNLPYKSADSCLLHVVHQPDYHTIIFHSPFSCPSIISVLMSGGLSPLILLFSDPSPVQNSCPFQIMDTDKPVLPLFQCTPI